ncbi:Immunity protein 44 [Chitinophaga sp. CF118]|uniref:Imm44 family immunity protein n=1 Tax=Chitinophaga sp. CF118 TaxID=1884367 RepID=UPI0008F1E5EB|nr:Imm44 family immunity protein [Chitinophaga sp. CF118]SFD98604.1 Immunity protein 44 [Chitinophaga sp. CF118]
MQVHLTKELSDNISQKFRVVSDITYELNDFFNEKHYGDDLQVLYIGLFCMSPNVASIFKLSKPKYIFEGKEYIFDGMQRRSDDRSLQYELRLDYDIYNNSDDIRPIIVSDMLKSLDVITTIKKIKDFDLDRFENDFEQFFKLKGWI